MIINDTFKFVFLHIPKCAGSTVRHKLQPFDETNGAYDKRDYHAGLGLIDYGHIPLIILKEFFTDDYKKVLNYESYTIIREPYSRFPSSLFQHLKLYGKSQIQNPTVSEVKKEIINVISVLQNHYADQSYLPYQYIHFQRQADFVYCGGERLVNHVYDISDIHLMFAAIGRRLGVNLEGGQKVAPSITNETGVYRNAIIQLLSETTRPILKRFLTTFTREKLSKFLRRFLYISKQEKLYKFFESQYIRDFISEYYASDIQLYNEICTKGTKPK